MNLTESELNFFLTNYNTMRSIIESIEFIELERDKQTEILMLFIMRKSLHKQDFKDDMNSFLSQIIKFFMQEEKERILLEINSIDKVSKRIKYLNNELNNIKLRISENNMEIINNFGINEIEAKNPLIDYIQNLIELLERENIDDQIVSEIESHFQPSMHEKEKFVYLHKLGVINHFKKLVSVDNGSFKDKQLYPLISLCSGMSEATIKRLMTFSKNPNNSGSGNPFKDKEIMDRVNKFLINNNISNIED